MGGWEWTYLLLSVGAEHVVHVVYHLGELGQGGLAVFEFGGWVGGWVGG